MRMFLLLLASCYDYSGDSGDTGIGECSTAEVLILPVMPTEPGCYLVSVELYDDEEVDRIVFWGPTTAHCRENDE